MKRLISHTELVHNLFHKHCKKQTGMSVDDSLQKKYPNMTIVYTMQDIPKVVTKSIFLAGPCPREDNSLSWKPQALQILNDLGYDGVVYNPEYAPGENFNNADYEQQCSWEHKCLNACDVIVFWIPREDRADKEMLGMTTNVEFGFFFNSNKLVIGGPKDAYKNEYLQFISKDKYKWHDDLESLLEDAVNFIGDGATRNNEEVLVPSHIFNSAQFQNWYSSILKVGNSLKNFKMEYSFIMPKAKQLFLAIFKPDVQIQDENRIKDNEFVIARTDMSYICAYMPNYDDILETKLVICEEFRSPARNDKGKVFELPGGSSLKDNEDRLQTASDEFNEEVGVYIDKNRFEYIDMKQSAATLCSHDISLYAIELTERELNNIDVTHVHGIIEETERIHLHILTVREFMKYADWTNIGMVMTVIHHMYNNL